MFSHFTKMAFKAFFRFKLHSIISLLSLVFGFICFIAASLLSNYVQSFDQHFPNADKTYNVIQKYTTPDVGVSPIMPHPAARFLRAAFPEIPHIVRTTPGSPTDVTIDGQTGSLLVRYVETGFFDIFPLPMLNGIGQGTNLPPNSAVITEDAALRQFGTTDVVGRRLILNNQSDIAIVGPPAGADAGGDP